MVKPVACCSKVSHRESAVICDRMNCVLAWMVVGCRSRARRMLHPLVDSHELPACPRPAVWYSVVARVISLGCRACRCLRKSITEVHSFSWIHSKVGESSNA